MNAAKRLVKTSRARSRNNSNGGMLGQIFKNNPIDYLHFQGKLRADTNAFFHSSEPNTINQAITFYPLCLKTKEL